MRMLSEVQVEKMRQEIALERPEPIQSGEIKRNSQYRIYQIRGLIFALEVAVPSGFITEITVISEEDIPKYIK